MYNRQRGSGAGTVGRNPLAKKIILFVFTVLFLVMVGGMIYIQWDYLTRPIPAPSVPIAFILNIL